MESTYPRGPWSSSPALQLIIKSSLAPLLLPKWGLKKNVGGKTLNLVSAQKFCSARCTHADNPREAGGGRDLCSVKPANGKMAATSPSKETAS